MSIQRQRTIFVVLAPAGTTETAMAHHMDVNQTLSSVMQIMLALPQAFQSDAEWGSLDTYAMTDLYGQSLEPDLLVRQVPFPGCVIAVSRKGTVEMKGDKLSGDDAAAVVAHSIVMKLLAYRKGEEDPVARRYARYIQSGFWRFEPTPITEMDLGLTYHEADEGAGTRLAELLTKKGLRCSVRVAKSDGSSSGVESNHSPAEDARALVVMISQATKDDPWIAYDVGAAWATSIPVVPVLVGKWDAEPPNILSPYQRLSWDEQQERIVGELVELLDLTPLSLADLVQDDSEPPHPE